MDYKNRVWLRIRSICGLSNCYPGGKLRLEVRIGYIAKHWQPSVNAIEDRLGAIATSDLFELVCLLRARWADEEDKAPRDNAKLLAAAIAEGIAHFDKEYFFAE